MHNAFRYLGFATLAVVFFWGSCRFGQELRAKEAPAPTNDARPKQPAAFLPPQTADCLEAAPPLPPKRLAPTPDQISGAVRNEQSKPPRSYSKIIVETDTTTRKQDRSLSSTQEGKMVEKSLLLIAVGIGIILLAALAGAAGIYLFTSLLSLAGAFVSIAGIALLITGAVDGRKRRMPRPAPQKPERNPRSQKPLPDKGRNIRRAALYLFLALAVLGLVFIAAAPGSAILAYGPEFFYSLYIMAALFLSGLIWVIGAAISKAEERS